MLRNRPAIAVEQTRRFAGDAGAVFRCVRNVWKKISGECPVTALHGNARTVIGKTDSAISRDLMILFLIFIANLLFFA